MNVKLSLWRCPFPKKYARQPKLLFIASLLLLSQSFVAQSFAQEATFASNQQPVRTQKRIVGRVTDPEGQPLPGASVRLKGFGAGVATDIDGGFALMIPDGQDFNTVILQVTFVGMQPLEIRGENRPMNIRMSDDENVLSDVVVTGYQRIDRRQTTSSITSLKAEDILTPGINTIDMALAGRVPDLVVSANSGAAGATSRLRVRGTSSILGNREPLWVVDGFIVTDPVNINPEQLNDPDFVNLIGNAIAGVNPQDIDRIDVLKDASATALYGTRAANGVIVITTKQGREGPVRVSYDHTSKFMTRPTYGENHINLMNSYERVQFGKNLADIHYVFPSQMAQVGYEGAFLSYQRGQISFDEFSQRVQTAAAANTDWLDLLTQNSYSSTHNLQVSGGTANLRYFSSLAYDKTNGVAKGEYTDRISMRANLNATISPQLRMRLSLNGNIQKKNHAASEINLLNFAFNTSRAIPEYNADGTRYFYPHRAYSLVDGSKQLSYNIFNELENSSRTYNGNGFGGNVDLTYKPVRNLELSLSGSYNRNNTLQERWWGEKSHYVSILRNDEYGEVPPKGDLGRSYLPYGGILYTDNTINESYTGRFQGDYNLFLGKDDDHLINMLLGGEVYSNRYYGISDENRGFLKNRGLRFIEDVDLDDYPLYKNWINKNHRNIQSNISNQVSSYFTTSYSYRQDFTLNVNARIDYSNKFGDRAMERFLPIWSASGRWNIHNNLARNIKPISELVLRASWGKQGNMLDTESPNMIIRQGAVDPFYNENVSVISRFPNPNLRWEQTWQTNTALSVSLFDNKLGFDAEYWYKQTNDVFMPVNVLSTNGVRNYVMNGGSLSNKGYSFSVRYMPVSNKDMQWNIYAYLSKAFNSVKSSSSERYNLQSYLGGYAVIDGYPISSFFSYKYLGLNPTNGVPLFDDYQDRRHLLMGKSLEETVLMTMENSGTRDPVFSGSLSNTLRYKQVTLAFNLTYSLGAKMRLFNLYEQVRNGVKAETNIRNEFTQRWMAPGDEKLTDIPVIMGTENPEYYTYLTHYSAIESDNIPTFAESVWKMYDLSNLRVVPADFLKLSSLSVRYRFSDNLFKNMPFERLEASVNGMNLYTLSNKKLKGQDPMQAGFAVPQIAARPTFTLQFNVMF